jgi:hypothetical protein
MKMKVNKKVADTRGTNVEHNDGQEGFDQLEFTFDKYNLTITEVDDNIDEGERVEVKTEQEQITKISPKARKKVDGQYAADIMSACLAEQPQLLEMILDRTSESSKGHLESQTKKTKNAYDGTVTVHRPYVSTCHKGEASYILQHVIEQLGFQMVDMIDTAFAKTNLKFTHFDRS